MEKKLKSWQGWLLFGGTMVVVFVLGMIAASVNERHAEVTSVMNNKKTEITGIEARNDKFELMGGARICSACRTGDTEILVAQRDLSEKWMRWGISLAVSSCTCVEWMSSILVLGLFPRA